MNRVEHQKLNQPTAELSFCRVFGVQLGLLQTQALISTNQQTIIQVLNSACVCRTPSWTPKAQPKDSTAVVSLRFWCSTRNTRKKNSLETRRNLQTSFRRFWLHFFWTAPCPHVILHLNNTKTQRKKANYTYFQTSVDKHTLKIRY